MEDMLDFKAVVPSPVIVMERRCSMRMEEFDLGKALAFLLSLTFLFTITLSPS
jgi:hypothetical protein